MKINFILLFVFLLLLPFALFISCGDENETTGDEETSVTKGDIDKRYGLESAIVKYKITGSQKGDRTLYFENWGMKQADYTNATISIAGFSKSTNIVSIMKDDGLYTLDLENKTGTKTKNPVTEEQEKLKYEKNFNEFGEQMLLSMGAEKTGTGSVLGRECDIYEIKSIGTSLWVWKWITLKSVTETSGFKIVSEATEINTNVNIPDDKFEIPDDFVINEVDLDNIEDQLKKEMQK